MKKQRYTYHNNLLMRNPMKKVDIKFKNKFRQLFCKHAYQYLVENDTTSMWLNPKGDDIVCICTKCGKIKYRMFWEHEGMGYK